MTHEERAGYLTALAEELDSRANDIAGTWTGEMGALLAMTQMSIPASTGAFRYYAGLAQTYPFLEKAHSDLAPGAFIVREPVGVVAAIVPWNGPFQLASLKVGPALLAGCTIILKASPEAPTTLYHLADAAAKVGIPAGVLNMVTADRAASESLVRHPGVDKVSFTGSNLTGRRIAAICGDRIARCTLELGGKSAAIVLDDYDVDAFAEQITAASIILTGQVCAMLSRVIVSRHRHDAVVDAIADKMRAVKVGDPFDPATQMGPLAMKRQYDKVTEFIAQGQTEGARLAAGGGRPAGLNRGYYVEPTLFCNVDKASTIAQEEIFGPVLSVIPVDSEEEAVSVANDSRFGLNGAVFTNDASKAYEIARRVRTGTISQNAFRFDPSLGFGGFKESGIGREGGIPGLLPYLESKAILLDEEITIAEMR